MQKVARDGIACAICGVAFCPVAYDRGRFCSDSRRECCSKRCAGRLNARRCGPKAKSPREEAAIRCDGCKVWFTPLRFRSSGYIVRYDRRACSLSCAAATGRKAKGRAHPRWKGTRYLVSQGFRGHEWTRIRVKVLKRDGHCCVICRGTDRLCVDHKVPFHNFPSVREANRLGNLQTLCCHCHPREERPRIAQLVLPLGRVGHKGSPRGERHFNAKLTRQQVERIRKDPRIARIVAAEYGVHRNAIYMVRKAESWAWLK